MHAFSQSNLDILLIEQIKLPMLMSRSITIECADATSQKIHSRMFVVNACRSGSNQVLHEQYVSVEFKSNLRPPHDAYTCVLKFLCIILLISCCHRRSKGLRHCRARSPSPATFSLYPLTATTKVVRSSRNQGWAPKVVDSVLTEVRRAYPVDRQRFVVVPLDGWTFSFVLHSSAITIIQPSSPT